MKLKRILSGGQTGADRAGLECARDLGLETGGTAPKGYRTERGNDPCLKDFGLVEDLSSSYPPRTRLNVKHADATVWFGNIDSPGYWCTKNACAVGHKPFFENPKDFKALCEQYEVINIAGNRASRNPSVVGMVQQAFHQLDNT